MNLPTDWKAWAFILASVFLVMVGLVAITALLAGAVARRGIRFKKGDVMIGAEHECTKGSLFERIMVSLDLLQSGVVAVLDWAIKSGANANTQEIRDALVENATAYQRYLIKKGVGSNDSSGN